MVSKEQVLSSLHLFLNIAREKFHKACKYAQKNQPKQLDFGRDLAKFSKRQKKAVRLLLSGKVKFLLYGGALGGGKSYLLRWYAVLRLIIIYKKWGLRNVVGMLACEDYPSLKDRQLAKISREFPRWLGRMHGDHKDYGRCFILNEKYGAGVICFRNLDDPSKYASAEFAFILVDELTKNNYDVFTFLRTRLRWVGLPEHETQFVGATNPGSKGHGWVKLLWMDKVFGDEWIKPIDFRGMFAYVPSKAKDNPHLDAAYWSMLQTLPENLRKAFVDGNWDIFVGQAFPEFSRSIHVIKPIPIPPGAPIYMTKDWGYGKPFSIGWWWVDNDNRIYRFAEWYGWNGTADVGLRLTDSQIAEGLIQRENKLRSKYKPGIPPKRAIQRLAGPDCWNKKPDYQGGGQGPSTAEVFQGSPYYLIMRPGDPNRTLKLRQFRERLRVPEDGTPPMMLIYDCCTQFIRTIPNLVLEENNIEDIDTKTEDHVYDETCHICMARPLSMEIPDERSSFADKRIRALEEGFIDEFERDIILETMEEQRQHDDIVPQEDLGYFDDGGVSYGNRDDIVDTI